MGHNKWKGKRNHSSEDSHRHADRHSGTSEKRPRAQAPEATAAASAPIKFDLGGSFEGACKKFNRSNGKGRTCTCEGTPLKHVLISVAGGNAGDLFSAIRNSRCCAEWGSVTPLAGLFRNVTFLCACSTSIFQYSAFNSSMSGTEPREALALLDASVNQVKERAKDESFSFDCEEAMVIGLQIVASLDTLYWHLFMSQPSQLPKPHQYFADFVSTFSPPKVGANIYETYLNAREIEAARFLKHVSLACFRQEGNPAGPLEGTMRGNDPSIAPTLRAYVDSVRDSAARFYAFAVPSSRAVEAMRKYSTKVLEVGAGTGFWSHFLQTQGFDVVCSDITPTSSGGGGSGGGGASERWNEYHGNLPSWCKVEPLGADAAIARYGNGRAVLMCYPPPGGKMAMQVLRGGVGACNLVYLVGEFAGDTGSLDFERELRKSWSLQEEVKLPNFANTVYSLTIWRRGADAGAGAGAGAGGSPKRWPLQCINCQATPTSGGGKWFRDRLTRAVIACSKSCVKSIPAKEALERQLADRNWRLPDVDESTKFKHDDKHLWRLYTLL